MMEERWKEIRKLWAAKESQSLYTIVGFLVGLTLIPFLIRHSEILADLFPEVFGIAVTVFVIDRLNEARSIRQQKEALILQMGSPNNALAVEAARILRRHQWGWNEDMSLCGKLFIFADLTQADLGSCNLQRALLRAYPNNPAERRAMRAQAK